MADTQARADDHLELLAHELVPYDKLDTCSTPFPRGRDRPVMAISWQEQARVVPGGTRMTPQMMPGGQWRHHGRWPGPDEERAALARLRAAHRHWGILFDPFAQRWIAVIGDAATGRTIVAATPGELHQRLSGETRHSKY